MRQHHGTAHGTLCTQRVRPLHLTVAIAAYGNGHVARDRKSGVQSLERIRHFTVKRVAVGQFGNECAFEFLRLQSARG